MEIRWKFYCNVVATQVPTNLSIPIAGEMKEKEGLTNLFKDGRWGEGGGKSYFNVMVDREILTYLENKK